MQRLTLPLFPLHSVLFPGGPLPLRVFESRYLDMISSCLKAESGIGICLIRSGSGFQVTDAGSNDIVRVHGDGTTSTDFLVPVNVTPVRTAEAVPTGIVRAKDGTVYFADMSGMVAGSARIWKAVPGQQPEVLVTGLTNLIDLAVDCQGDLLALSFTEGFQAGPPLPAKLSKIDTAARTVTEIPTGGLLNQPTGLAVGLRNQVYVTNNAHSADGQLVRVRY